MGKETAAPRGGKPVDPGLTGYWWKVLLGGIALWVLTVVVTLRTGNTNLIPTIILLGSFLVPFVVVLFVGARQGRELPPTRLFSAFFIGGIFGVLGASLLEADLASSPLLLVLVGFIEEFVKFCILVVAARGVRERNAVLGGSLGAVVGAGFAAFESAGYAFNAALGQNEINLSDLLNTEIVRAGLSPIGHILWTAILGATFFSLRRFTNPVFRLLITYAGASILHSLWDLMGPLSTFLALRFTGAARFELTYGYLPRAAVPEIVLATQTIYIGGTAAITVVGLWWLIATVRAGRRRAPSGS